MTLSEELQWRGFIAQSTYENITDLDSGVISFYHGFDASSDSQTVGNLAAMMLDLVLLRHGHKAYVLAGGSTSLIGDPGGKDKERPLQSVETVAHNVECAKKQIDIIYREHTGKYEVVNNLDWTKDLTVLDFLRDIGKHFSMTSLVQRDYIADRMGEGGVGISYTEFSYTLLQGLDYLHLFDKFGVTLQLGGSDQWGNCLSGVDLIRKARGAEAHVITLPLIINKATGRKFGKSEEGAVWLDSAKTSPYKFYQFWLNSDDQSVVDYLKIFTTLDKSQINNLEKELSDNPGLRLAQKSLAFEVTKLVHGQQVAEQVVGVTGILFGSNETPSADDWQILEAELPVVKLEPEQKISEVLVNSGLASSFGEARRHITAGAVSISGQKQVEDVELVMNSEKCLLKLGKNKYVVVVR
jgi:tyrosyl-tRNA synthetase